MSEKDHISLPEGTDIAGYRLLRVLGDGGFGITYLAENYNKEKFAIKEYLPSQFAVRDGIEVHPNAKKNREDFEWGRESFVEEARMLARFKHPNIVEVKHFVEMNNTAYIVMEYEDGEPLDELLRRRGALTEAQLKRILFPIADGLCEVHRQGVWHRDIKPANVFVRRSDESPVLLDFGAARNALGVKSKSMETIVSPPYSPPEQYDSDGELGPYTDIYALSALCYRAITGKLPEESPRRQRSVYKGYEDPLRSLAEAQPEGYLSALLEAVDWGLRLNEEERPQNVDEWLAAMHGTAPTTVPPSPPQSDTYSALHSERPWEEPDRNADGTVWERIQRDVRDAEEAAGDEGRPAKLLRRTGSFRNLVWAATILGLAGLMLLVFISSPRFVGELGAWLQPPPAPTALPPPRVASFTVTNRSHKKIEVVRAAPVAMGNYGDNKLGMATISSGAKHEVLLGDSEYGDACEFDVFIRAEDRQTYEEKKQDLCRNNDVVFGGEDDAPAVDLFAVDPVPVPEPTPPPKEPEPAEPFIDCPTCQPFTVRTGPPDARVQIMNIRPPYEAGINLPPGSYDVRVTAHGFDRVDRTLRHGNEPTNRWIGLPFQDCPVCPKMIELPMGSYRMGTSRGPDRFPDEGPKHDVAIQYPIAVGVFEVLFEEWDACVDEGGCTRHLQDEGRGRGQRPVVHATVADAKEYANWLTAKIGRRYRLLSEAEWEYAALAGTSSDRHWGGRLEDQCVHENGADVTAQIEYNDWTIANCNDGHVYAAPSSETRFRPNPWGLHHMLGNVSEWTADCWHQNYVGAPRDGSAWTNDCDAERRQEERPVRHVLRGGSWSSVPREVRAPTRLFGDPAEGSADVGFRVAVEITR